MTSLNGLNGNIFRVTGHSCGEFTGHRWIPRTKTSDAELCFFYDLHLNKRLSKQWRGWWFDTPSHPLWRHCSAKVKDETITGHVDPMDMQHWLSYLWKLPSSLLYKPHLSRQLNCWSLRCSWSIACRRCSNYIFILSLTPVFNGLSRDNGKTRRRSFKFWDLVRLILEILR